MHQYAPILLLSTLSTITESEMENHVSTRIIVKHALLLRIYKVAVTVACVLQVQNERTNTTYEWNKEAW